MLKRYIFVCLPLIFLLNSQTYSHGGRPIPDVNDAVADRNCIFYLHPTSLIYGLAKSETLIYTTLLFPDFPMPNSALVINPSYLNKDDYYRIGSGLGYRFFYDILYVQLMPSLHYLKYEDDSSGPMIEVLGYTGFILPLVDFNVGVGYKWNLVTKNHGLAVDVNIGLEPWFILFFPLILLAQIL